MSQRFTSCDCHNTPIPAFWEVPNCFQDQHISLKDRVKKTRTTFVLPKR